MPEHFCPEAVPMFVLIAEKRGLQKKKRKSSPIVTSLVRLILNYRL